MPPDDRWLLLRMSAASTTLRSAAKSSSSICLFYNLKLRACIVIDLKPQAFRAEFAGKIPVFLRGQ
jgi:hypothetical protein